MTLNFLQRSSELEVLDDFNIPKGNLAYVLQDINRANRILGGNRITLKAIEKLIFSKPQEHYTLLDLGCGDGAILREVVLLFRKMEKKVSCIGIDLNENALELARERSKDFPEIQFRNRNIMDMDTQGLESDILITTLTLHHFTNENIIPILERFKKLARIGVVINDLQRSALAHLLFKGFSLIFIHTQIAKKDGLLSIKRGFRKKELHHFAKQIKGMEHRIKWQWAFRYVWIMKVKGKPVYE